MGELKIVCVNDLKNHLRAYLREVRSGTHVLVTERGLAIAEIRVPCAQCLAASAMDPLLAAWVAAGFVRLPTCRKEALPEPLVRLPQGSAQRLLDAGRG